MACSQTLAGMLRDCSSNMGGIKAVYMANFDDVASVTVSGTPETVTAITMAASKKFYAYYFNPNTSNVVTTARVNRENGSLYYESVLSLVFPKLDATKRVEVNALAQAGLMAIVEDNNGKCWLLGKDEPMLLQDGGTAETGTAKADRNGYALPFIDAQQQLPYPVDPEIIDDLLA